MPILEEKRGTITERWIYRCKCGKVRRRDESYEWHQWYSQLPAGGPIKRHYVRRPLGQYEQPRCICGRGMRGEPVSGRYSESKKCGARCRNAKGGDCECQCSGANHGAGHEAL